MQTKLMVRNLAWDITDVDLRDAFATCGEVVSTQVIKDATSGGNRGFGFIEMGTQVAAEAAIRNLNMRELKGRQLDIKFADDGKNAKNGRKRSRR